MRTPTILTLALGLLLFSSPLHAAPRGDVLAAAELAAELPAPQRARLRHQIASSRKRRPAAFAALARLRGRLPGIAARQRGRLVNLVPPLRALGRDGLMPMLAALTFERQPGLSPRARLGWQVSLLEAVGSLRDPRATPVLLAILADPRREPAVQRAAARGVARRGDDAAVATLLRLVGDPSRRAVLLPALGECRREAMARALAAMLRGSRGVETGVVVAALGQVGNAWAWETPAVARSGEGEVTRRLAMEALIAAFPALPTAVQPRAVKALALIGLPQTPAAIEAARRRAGGAQRRALARLGREVARLGLLR